MKDTNQAKALGYNHLEPGQPDNPRPFRVCGAHKSSGNVCLSPAGQGTSHVGMGRCKFHGGATLSGPDNPAYTKGRYSHLFRGRLAEHYKQIQEADESPLDLVPELQVQRTMLALAIDRIQSLAPTQPAALAEDNSNYLKHETADAVDMADLDPLSSSSVIKDSFTSQENMGDRGGDISLAYSESSSSSNARARLASDLNELVRSDPGVMSADEYRALVGNDESGSELIEMEAEEDKRGVYVRDDGYVVDTRNYKPRAGKKRREVGEQVAGGRERAEVIVGGGGQKLLVSPEDLELVLEYSNAIVATVGKMEAIRNNSALTKAEIVYLFSMIKETMYEFIPESDKRKAFIDKLIERVPIGVFERGGDEGAV